MLFLSIAVASVSAAAAPATVDIATWPGHFGFHIDHVLRETIGQAREAEPVELTLSVPGGEDKPWEETIRVVRIESGTKGIVVPHQVSGKTLAAAQTSDKSETSAPAQSVNVLFLATCPARTSVTYAIFWGYPKNDTSPDALPRATDETGLKCTGAAPGLSIENEYYQIALDPKSGAIRNARLAGRDAAENLFYGSLPIHFGVDVWSPPQGWDHDYDWAAPPNQSLESGPLMARYHRWGALQHYRDVQVSITYTFYAHVPYVHVSSTMEFSENRSVRAVRMGEIVVAHSHKGGPNEKDKDGKSPDLLSHYAWPNPDGSTQVLEVDAHRDETGAEKLPDTVSGAIAVLDRDVAWVAGYNTAKRFGIATLRGAQFAGNRLGGATPQSAPCTYVSNYGWGFTYWSRPMVYPPGEKGTPEDQNTAVAAGTLFGIDEALLFFEPDDELQSVRSVQQRFVRPLHHSFRGTGPW